MKLVIAEKPSVAASIAKVIGAKNRNNGKGSFSEVEKRNQTIAHSFLFCAKMKEFV